MSDNLAITPGAGATIAADDVAGVLYQRIKLGLGADGAATDALGGAGAVAAGVQRVTLASDDPVVVGVGAVSSSPSQFTLADRIRQANRLIVASFSTLTRPANQTAYTANDSISDSVTAASVSPLSATLSAYNDDPITLERLRIATTDTGLQSKGIRAFFYNSNPTSSSGVGAGDNAGFSNKQAGFIGSMSGTFRAFSDGAVAILSPDEGSRIATTPGAGAKTIWVQYQTLSDFTPSANSTTLIGTVEGFQGGA